ncbi:YueH-like protein [Thermolongibacillus altinsuensis]|uniref:YueH-like protein n=1 Tax=Thermolongibacillus altinsuensis TaxID=575256 RepID=A0A4R1QLR1_9BACL|nr:YueH family protein [Thermolongibacillus altinsuensis]TCL49227.1 YueH-like protein [Thermolongibacillus altinsuensis]GMB08675.1 hypothetical protein B1no1_13850 [Thermolongibacillus altinsuensis]
MKIRKAPIHDEHQQQNVYIYENKKEEYIVVSIPDLEWSICVRYEEETKDVQKRIEQSLRKVLEAEKASSLTAKIVQWIREM